MSANCIDSISKANQWKVGLVNHAGKYLTAENFGFKINASGSSMRKKQLWSLEQSDEDGIICLKSYLGRYLTTNKQGKVSCDMQEKNQGCQFGLVYHTDGRWAFQSRLSQCYLDATEDSVNCGQTAATHVQYWYIRLAMHPLLSLYHINRKRYMHLHRTNGKLQCDRLIPWGPDAVFTLEYTNGKYAFRSADNRYLSSSGSLRNADVVDGEHLFMLELHSGAMAFKDKDGKYLTAVGEDATIQSNSSKAGKDELFLLQHSHAQVCLTANNGKKISAKYGADLAATQDGITDTETFQLELDQTINQWRFRSSCNKFWRVSDYGRLKVHGSGESQDSLFTLEWYNHGRVALKCTNGKYVTVKSNGSMSATSDSVTDKEKYTLTLLNRSTLVLRCEYGFVGFKCVGNPKIECNKASYDITTLEHDSGKKGEYFFKGHNGQYWEVHTEGTINAVSDAPIGFNIELRGQSQCAIKAPNGCYLKAEQNGNLSANVTNMAQATFWEY